MSHTHKTFNGLYTKATYDENGEILTPSELHQSGFHVTSPKPIAELSEYEQEPDDYNGESGRKLGTLWSGVKGYWYILPDEETYLEIFPDTSEDSLLD